MTVLYLEDVGAPGETMTFSLEPILLQMDSEQYVGPLLTVPLAELVSRRRGGGGGRGGGGWGAPAEEATWEATEPEGREMDAVVAAMAVAEALEMQEV